MESCALLRIGKTSGGESVLRIASTDCPEWRICSRRARKMRFLSIVPLLEDLGEIDLSGIDWVIVGGESGPGARPMKREWVLSIREQCRSYGIPFFFKQWGGVRKAKAGRELDGRTYDEYPRRKPPPMPD